MFKKILVPVDPSEIEFAEKALSTAIGLADQPAGVVRLIGVVQPLSSYVTDYLPVGFEVGFEKEAEERLRGLAAKCGLDPARLSITLRSGSPYHEIVDEATDWGCDAIVISSHRPQMATYLLGSNAAKIVRHAPCSVLVLRG